MTTEHAMIQCTKAQVEQARRGYWRQIREGFDVTRSIIEINDLTAKLGGLKVDDYVLVYEDEIECMGLVNESDRWTPLSEFGRCRIVEVDPDVPQARIVRPASHRQTGESAWLPLSTLTYTL
jgi:hypothetical protein